MQNEKASSDILIIYLTYTLGLYTNVLYVSKPYMWLTNLEFKSSYGTLLHAHMNNSFLCVILIFIIHTHLPDRYDWKSHCTKANLILDPSLLWKLWADLTLIEVLCRWWGAVAWDVLQMYHEWSISNYNNLWETNACSLCIYTVCLLYIYLLFWFLILHSVFLQTFFFAYSVFTVAHLPLSNQEPISLIT